MQITTIGLDLAKHVFQVHGVDANEAVVEKRRLRRGQVLGYFAKLAPCRVGLEACATAHFWARELRRLGHEVRLIPPQYVKAYLKRGKNDAADAAAICEAATRPSMRFVPIKSEEQQAVLIMHRARDLLVRQRTQLINALRGHLAEFGLIEAQGPSHVRRLLAGMRTDLTVPELARETLDLLATALEAVDAQIDAVEAKITKWHKANPTSQPAPGDDPWHRTAHRLGHHCHRRGPGGLPQWARVCGVAGIDATSEVNGRQAAAWPDHPQGRSVSSTTADHRRPNSSAALEGGQSQSVDPGPAGTLRTAEGGGSAGQQDRADRLGSDDKRRMLSAGCCGLTKPCDLPAKACRRENEMEVSVVPTGWVNLKKSRASNPRI